MITDLEGRKSGAVLEEIHTVCTDVWAAAQRGSEEFYPATHALRTAGSDWRDVLRCVL